MGNYISKGVNTEDGSIAKAGDDQTLSNAVLENVTLSMQEGDLVVVCGPVGSGKSSLLAALLNEIPCCEGKVFLRGNVAYCAQVKPFPLALVQNLGWCNF